MSKKDFDIEHRDALGAPIVRGSIVAMSSGSVTEMELGIVDSFTEKMIRVRPIRLRPGSPVNYRVSNSLITRYGRACVQLHDEHAIVFKMKMQIS